MTDKDIALTTELSGSYQDSLEAVVDALRAEGFGILTNIDVQATMREKLGADMAKYTILGACNPPLAHRALLADPSVGLLLPCNVIVYESKGATVVTAVDPQQMLGQESDPELAAVAAEARERLGRAVSSLTQQADSSRQVTA